MSIVIVDYHKGNLLSVERGLVGAGADVVVTDKADVIRAADAVVLPGVGAFADAAASMEEMGQMEAVRAAVAGGAPFLGICLGMQLLGRRSEESNGVDLLGIIDEDVPKMTDFGLPLPHMGWNRVYPQAGNRLFQGIEDGAYFYFVHSYAMPVNPWTIAQCNYGEPFTAAVHKDNFYGVQFHPERSGAAGAKLLKNFLEM